MKTGLVRAIAALLELALMSCLGHSSGYVEGGETDRGYRILGFTALGDSALALHIEIWDFRTPPDTAPWPQRSFVLIDRKRGTIRALDTLPLAAAATFPNWFYTCAAGTPVSLHPPGVNGPPGTCTDSTAPAVTANGYVIVFVDSIATVRLFNSSLESFELLATDARRVEILQAEARGGIVCILEDKGRGDSVLWRGFPVDDASGGYSAWLTAPGSVRVQGEGTLLLCNAVDEAAEPLPCWSPGITGFRDALAAAPASTGALRPEWDPERGVLTYLDRDARFVSVNPVSGARASFDAQSLLAGYRP